MKNNIVVLSINAGHGHNAAAKAVQQSLASRYTTTTASIIKDILWPLDPFYMLSFGFFSLEKLYNVLIQHKQNRSANYLSGFAHTLLPVVRFFMYPLIFQALKKLKPAALVSVTPVMNALFCKAAKKLSIPFIIVPTDLDPRWFLHGLEKKDSFICTVPFDDVLILQFLKDKVEPRNQCVTGFPVKKSFLDAQNKAALKKEFNIAYDKKVLMLLMGGMGSNALLSYLKELQTYNKPLHLLICAGKNETLIEEIKQVTWGSTLDCWADDVAKKYKILLPCTWRKKFWQGEEPSDIDLEAWQIYSLGCLPFFDTIKKITIIKRLEKEKIPLDDFELPCSLEELTIEVNYSFEKFPEIKSYLTKLIFTNNKIKEIPNNIWFLKNIQILSLHNNEISELPEEFSKLEELTVLDLSRNKFTEFPKNLPTNLIIVSFNDNQIAKIPPDLIPSGLKKLFMYRNNQLEKGQEIFENESKLPYFTLHRLYTILIDGTERKLLTHYLKDALVEAMNG